MLKGIRTFASDMLLLEVTEIVANIEALFKYTHNYWLQTSSPERPSVSGDQYQAKNAVDQKFTVFVFRFRPSRNCSLLLLFLKTRVQDRSRVLNEGRNSYHGLHSSSRSEHVEELEHFTLLKRPCENVFLPRVNNLAFLAPSHVFLDRFFLTLRNDLYPTLIELTIHTRESAKIARDY